MIPWDFVGGWVLGLLVASLFWGMRFARLEGRLEQVRRDFGDEGEER